MFELFVILAMSVEGSGKEAPPGFPSVAEVEKRILDARRKIRRGMLEFDWTAVDNNGKSRTSKFASWFDFDTGKNRLDRTDLDPNGKPHRLIECRNCEKPGYSVSYDDIQLRDGVKVLKLAPLRGNRKPVVFDPRLIGFVGVNPELLWNHHLETHLASSDRIGLRVKRDAINGVPCLVVTFSMKNGNLVEVWADPERDYSVLRVQVERQEKDALHRAMIENKVEQHEPSGIWFPKTSTYTTMENGKTTTSVTTHIASASFNQPFDSKAFSLAGMGLRKGVVVDARSEDSKPRAYRWDGEALTRRTPTIPLPQATPQNNGSTWLYWLAGGLGVAALIAFWFYLRQKAAAPI